MTDVAIRIRGDLTAPVALSRSRSITVVVRAVLTLLHAKIAKTAGSSRRARAVEAAAGVLLAAGYGYFLLQATAGSSDLLEAPSGMLLAYVLLVIPISGIVMTSAMLAVVGVDRSGLENLLIPLPLDRGGVRLGLIALPLALSYAVASVPVLALVSVYLQRTDAATGSRILFVVAALVLLAAAVPVTAAIVHIVTRWFARLRFGSLSHPAAAALLVGVTVAGATTVGSSLTDVAEWTPITALDEQLTHRAFLALVVVGAIAAFAVVARLALIVLARPLPAFGERISFLVDVPTRGSWLDLEFRQQIRSTSIVSTIFLAAAAQLIAVAGSPYLLDLPSTAALPSLGFYLLPFMAVYSFPATSAHHWVYRTSPFSGARWVLAKITVPALLVAGTALGMGTLGSLFDAGLSVGDVGAGAPYLAFGFTVSMYCGLLLADHGDDPTSPVAVYFIAMLATIATGSLVIRNLPVDHPVVPVAIVVTSVLLLWGYVPLARRTVAVEGADS